MVADLPDDRQPDDIAERGKVKVLQVVKSNYAVPPAPRLFRRPLDRAIRWEGESALTIEDCFAGAAGKRGPAPEERSEAESMLRDMLAHGPVKVAEIVEVARQLGISERTLRRTRKAMGIAVVKQSFDGPWLWALDQGAHPRHPTP